MTILEKLQQAKEKLMVYTNVNGRPRVVRNISIYPTTVPISVFKHFDPQNLAHVENFKLPELVISGDVDGERWWWDKDGHYYNIDFVPGIVMKKDFIPDPKKDLHIL